MESVVLKIKMNALNYFLADTCVRSALSFILLVNPNIDICIFMLYDLNYIIN